MAKKPHIICVGSATQDIFLTGKSLTEKRDVRTQSSVEQFPLGSKVELDGVHFAVGGGASNAAVTFARQGMVASLLAKVGNDPAAAEIMRVMNREGVDATHVTYDRVLGSSYSTILLAPSGERVVLVYRGASHDLKAKDFAIPKLVGDWMYITSLAGNFDLLKQLLRQARAASIKVAFAPGTEEIKHAGKLRKLLPAIDVLLGNSQEMQQIFEATDLRDLLLTSFGLCDHIVVTDGPNGSYVSDSDRIYKAPPYKKVKVVDRTGAGDAFGSGFIAALANGETLEMAMTLASANSTSVVQHYGAKKGILRFGNIKPLKVEAISL